MLVYLATPHRAETPELFEKQLAYTKMLARHYVKCGIDVIVPHLYYPQFLDDDCEDERTLGMKSAMNLIKVCDLLVVGDKFGKSSGVLAEIEFAEVHKIPIKEVS